MSKIIQPDYQLDNVIFIWFAKKDLAYPYLVYNSFSRWSLKIWLGFLNPFLAVNFC